MSDKILDFHEIEGRAECAMDNLDHKFLNTAMTQAEYDAEVKRIREWVTAQEIRSGFRKDISATA